MVLGEEWRTNIVVHISSTQQPNSHVVRELDLVDVRAVVLNMGSIVDVVISIHQTHVLNPIPGLLRMLGIGGIVRVSRKSGTDVEEAAVRNGVLVIVSSQVWVYLPPKSALYQPKASKFSINSPSTTQAVRSSGLRIEDSLSKRKPLGRSSRRILEVRLCSGHSLSLIHI